MSLREKFSIQKYKGPFENFEQKWGRFKRLLRKFISANSDILNNDYDFTVKVWKEEKNNKYKK